MSSPASLPRARTLLVVLLTWDALLLVLAAYFQLTWRGSHAHRHLREVFVVSSEAGLVTWSSVVTQCALGVACLARGGQTGRFCWKLAGAFFVFLSMDDQAMLHERLGWVSSAAGGSVYAWLVVVLPWLGLVGLWVLVSLWRETRGTPARFGVLGAAGLWGVALGLEFAEKRVRDGGATWRGIEVYRYGQWLEEGCELVAPALLLAGVLAVVASVGRRREGERAAPAAAGPRRIAA